MANTIQTSNNLNRKLSTAVGLLSFSAFIIQGLGSTYGFEAVAQQITQTCLLISGGISVYFLGSTTQKNIEDDKERANEKRAK